MTNDMNKHRSCVNLTDSNSAPVLTYANYRPFAGSAARQTSGLGDGIAEMT